MPIFVNQVWSAVVLFVAKVYALGAAFLAKAWALVALPSIRAGLLILAFVAFCYLLFAFSSWIDGVRWRRRYLPRGRRRRSAGTGIRRRRRCWSVVEGSGYEVHHERRPVDAEARRRVRECWGVTCVSCGTPCRDSRGEVAHFPSMAQAALTVWEQGWTTPVGEVRCPTCSGFIDSRLRELQAQDVV